MRKVAWLMHVSLDGFVADAKGGMGWISLSSELFDYVSTITNECDTALYGAVTFKMMEDYWPTAGDKPGASKHAKEHSRWANNALKLVFSKHLKSTDWQNTEIVRGDIPQKIASLKAKPGKKLLMLGSPSLGHSFMRMDLIDEFYLNINPIILGAGTPLFKDVKKQIKLKLISQKEFPGGVIATHYT